MAPRHPTTSNVLLKTIRLGVIFYVAAANRMPASSLATVEAKAKYFPMKLLQGFFHMFGWAGMLNLKMRV
jgi:hypothetical protein